jgi:DNA-directed RNA polymerases I, II, and III subunit RPABC2
MGADDNANLDNDVVYSGDAEAAAAAEERRKRKANRNTVAEEQNKKIPKEKRSTTPYMTKYERARVLGTRALQIRYTCFVYHLLGVSQELFG